MKRITALLLTICLLFSIGIINSCSCTGCAGNAKVEKTSYTTDEALEDTVKWLMDTYTNGDRSIVEKYLTYKILPANTNSPCFVRYTMSTISARDLLVFKDGEVIVIDDDNMDKAQSYNYLFPVDITKVTDEMLTSQKNCVTGNLQK